MKDQLLGEGQFADLRQKMEFNESVITQYTLIVLRVWSKVENKEKGLCFSKD